ncbi:hypothetical protein DIPPA_14304 [Diplonema papillatum]|nr:hypothetical protein DIPPA_14304 [Diplonema papillatum]
MGGMHRPALVALAFVACFALRVSAVAMDIDNLDDSLDQVRDEIERMRADDSRGMTNGIGLKSGSIVQQPQFKYTVGQSVVVAKQLVFKASSGKRARTIEAGSIGTVTAVPGDVEGSVAEVRMQSTGTLFDPRAEQILPLDEWERQERIRIAKEDAETDWAGKIEALLKEHAPKKIRKLPAMLKAWNKKEKDLFKKLEKEFSQSQEL